MAHSFTREQQAAIDTRDKTLLVSAAAGSGKTATLTQRIIASLLDEENPADISELLIVTFTNAAVGELKERIGKAIRDRLAEDLQNQRLQRQLLLLPSATICTIDAFCNQVLRDNTGAVGIPPNYRIADAAEAELLGGAVCESLIAAAYEGDLADAIDPTAFAELCDALTGAKTDSALASIFLALYRKCETHERGVCSLRDLQKEYDGASYTAPEHTRLGAYIIKAASEMAEHYANVLQRILADFPMEGKEAVAMHDILANEQYRLYHLSKARTYSEIEQGLRDFTFERQPTFRGDSKTEKIENAIRVRKEYKEAIASYRKKFFLYTTEQFKELYINLYKYTDILCAFLEKFDFVFREEKARRGLCEYADIERYAYRCLWDGDQPSAYARELSEKYSAVYIDEYQDVNRLQNLVFEAVSRPNNRFMVGDIKQSIYSFRSADPTIFAEMKNTFPPLEKAGRSHAASIFMSQNFRCDEGVVNFVNRVFDTVFGKLGESIGYVPEDRLCFSKLAPVGDHFPEITLVSAAQSAVSVLGDGENEDEAEEEERPDAVEAEARAVGKKILALLDGGKKNDGTPIRPGDIAVIFRALHSKAPIYTRVFASMGIDCAVGDEKSLLLAPEVLLCLCLLNSIDNPHRDIYLAGLLCSPLYGFTPDDLVRYRRSEKERGQSLFSVLEDYAAEHPEDLALAGFLSSLARYQLMAEGLAVDVLLTKLYAESSLLSLAAKNGGRDNLLLLKDYAARYEAGGFSGLYSFIHYINNLLENRTDFDSKRPSAADENRVQLITVHASKGLEYPVCFMVGCGSEITDQEKGPFAYVEGFGLAFRLRDSSGLSLVESPAMNAVLRKRFEKGFEEELRILYVALTRARERLYLFGTVTRTTPEAYLARVEEQLPYLDAYALCRMHSFMKIALASATGATVHIEGRDAAADAVTDPIEEKTAETAVTLSEEAVARFVSRFNYTYENEALASVPRKLSVSALKPTLLDERMVEEALPSEDVQDPYMRRGREESVPDAEAPAPTLPKFITGKREEESARRGIATHLFLQFCDFLALRDLGAEAELARLIREKYLSEEDGARVRLSEIERFRDSRLLDDILAAKALHREMRFHARMPAVLFTENEERRASLGEHRILVQGVMDCLFEDESGALTLIDYKTDRLPREALSDPSLAAEILSKKHREQLSYYAMAVEQMFGKWPHRILVYSLHLGNTVQIEALPLQNR